MTTRRILVKTKIKYIQVYENFYNYSVKYFNKKNIFWGLQRCKYMYMYISTNKLTDICTSTTCKLALIKAVKVSYS